MLTDISTVDTLFRWDIFCRVIDNWGDIGFCTRLVRELARRGHTVRLWVDDFEAAKQFLSEPIARLTIEHWTAERIAPVTPYEVVVEALGCHLDAHWVTAMQKHPHRAWINLEYLSAESYVKRSHGLASPTVSGLKKYFFYPGFEEETGGLLQEQDLQIRQSSFNSEAWLKRLGIEKSPIDRCISLFCYAHAPLKVLVGFLLQRLHTTHLLVCAGSTQETLAQLGVESSDKLRIHYLPFLSQDDFDHLLWACDFNFVRGEDSWVRAILAGKPFIWQAYWQQDGSHESKVDAFLRRYLMPMGQNQDARLIEQLYRLWNGLTSSKTLELDLDEPKEWPTTKHLYEGRELAARLVQFVASR